MRFRSKAVCKQQSEPAGADVPRVLQHKQPGPQQRLEGFTTVTVTLLQLLCTCRHKPREGNMVAKFTLLLTLQNKQA